MRSILVSCSFIATFLLFGASAWAQVTALRTIATAQGESAIVAELPSGPSIIHRTPYAVSELAQRPIGEGPGAAATWNELIDEREVPHFALSLDGRKFYDARETSNTLLLRYAHFDPLHSTPVVPAHLDSAMGGRLWIVQYWTQGLPEYRDALRALGAEVHLFLANNANVVEMSGATAAAVQSLPFVRWVGSFQPAYKLDESLLAEQIQGWSAVKATRVNILSLRRGMAGQQPVAERVRAIGGTVQSIDPNTYLMEATLDLAQVAEIARMDEVQWIDPWGPPGEDMDIARIFHGAIYVEAFGFDGTGVRGEVLDGGTQQSHPEFAPGPIVHGSSPSNSHGTSTYGQIFAKGNSPQARGILHNGIGIAASYNSFSTGTRYGHTTELVNPGLQFQACFQSNSWGSPQVLAYTSESQAMDLILFDHDITITQSQSNTNNQTSRPQAWAKNIVSVGGIRHLNTLTKSDDVWQGASIGPAADGRIKPDIASFYDSIFTTTTTSTYTSSFGGTSGATPIVAGNFGIFFQMWHQGLFGNTPSTSVFTSRPKATLAKAIMINTATQWSFSGANANLGRFKQGWGHPDLQTLYDYRNRMFWVNETDVLQNLQSTTYNVSVPSGEPLFQATLTWLDNPGTVSSTQHRINNLDLRVTAPNGTTYWGNNGLTAGTSSVAGGSPNTIDTVENVIVPNPMPGTWQVTVIASELNQDNHIETPALDADYALVVRGLVAGPPPPPPFALDFSTVGGTGSLHLALMNIPAATVEGYCIFSLETTQPISTGPLLGLHPDVLSILCLTQPLAPGNVFHWTWPATNVFPDVAFDLPPASMPFMVGSNADGLSLALGPNLTFTGVSSVVRVTW